MCAYVRSLNLADARWCAQALRMELGFVDAEGAELHGAGGGEGYGEGSYTFTPAVCKACLGKHVKHICGRSREDGACAMCDRCHVPRRALYTNPPCSDQLLPRKQHNSGDAARNGQQRL